MNQTIKTSTAKKIGSKITKLKLEYALLWRNDTVLYLSWILLIISNIIFAFIVLTWVSGISPPPDMQPETEVSVVRPGQDGLEVMIVFISKDTQIKYLTYNTSVSSGFINRTTDAFEYVRDIGETGSIPAGNYSGPLRIYATLNNGKIRKIYDSVI
ncbi:MAG TPA: hypothetical protein VN316_01660 [candidate division Zixibacteria bacterium]|nr:hypothetical protein [candidate division Zixibacteria bacterium]